MKRLPLVLALATLTGCLGSPNAKYSYVRTGADCTVTIDSGRVFSSGVDLKLTDCNVEVVAGKIEGPVTNDLKDVLDLARILKPEDK